MLKITNLKKSFKNGETLTPILKDVSFDLLESETLSIVGKSGSGKSTIISLIAGLDFPDSGEINFRGKNLNSFSKEEYADFRLNEIGLVFQFFNFLPSLSIEQNVSLPAYLSKHSKKEIAKRTEECLSMLHIESLTKRLPHEISGGELQRAAIARAIFMKPSLILADEPTGNLDEKNADNVCSIFFSLVKEIKCSLILVTHDLSLSKKTSKELTLEDGSIKI